MSLNPFANPKCVFDMSKLPEELRLVPPAAFVLVLRAGFDFALTRTRCRHEMAMETTYQALYHLTTDQRWNPKSALSLRDHFIGLIDPSLRWLLHGSREEKKAAAFFAQEQGDPTKTPEQIAIYLEEQGELLIADATRSAYCEAIRARLAEHPVATGIIAIWAKDGNVRPRDLAVRLEVSRREIYSAIDLIRYHAAQCRKTRRYKGKHA